MNPRFFFIRSFFGISLLLLGYGLLGIGVLELSGIRLMDYFLSLDGEPYVQVSPTTMDFSGEVGDKKEIELAIHNRSRSSVRVIGVGEC